MFEPKKGDLVSILWPGREEPVVTLYREKCPRLGHLVEEPNPYRAPIYVKGRAAPPPELYRVKSVMPLLATTAQDMLPAFLKT
jgi:hypothetical protein